jgi:hypothetical protein
MLPATTTGMTANVKMMMESEVLRVRRRRPRLNLSKSTETGKVVMVASQTEMRSAQPPTTSVGRNIQRRKTYPSRT